MPTTTYHLLTEAEPFSEYHGGAISRWAGNVLRSSRHGVVVCPAADDSWGFAPESTWVLPRLRDYRRLRKYLARLPWPAHARVILGLFGGLVERLCPGDIVWIHNRPEFAVALSPHIQSRGGRVVLHLHNAHLAEGPENLMRQVEVDRLVFASHFLLQQAERRFPTLGASSVLYSGADESIFYPAEARSRSHSPTVLFAGRLVEDKGVHILVEAMNLLEQQRVGVKANIVGSSNFGSAPETSYVRRLKAASPGTVTFLPYRSGAELGELFRQANIFCSPAVWDEPFGLVNVEAMATGLPVVTTRTGGASEIFSSGGGLLVERGSAVQLATALQRLAEDPDYRARLGQQGYAAFLRRFTWLQARREVDAIEQSVSGQERLCGAPEVAGGEAASNATQSIWHKDDDVYPALKSPS